MYKPKKKLTTSLVKKAYTVGTCATVQIGSYGSVAVCMECKLSLYNNSFWGAMGMMDEHIDSYH